MGECFGNGNLKAMFIYSLTNKLRLFLVLVCVDRGIKLHIEENFAEGQEQDTVCHRIVFRKVYNRGFILNICYKYPAVIKDTSAVMGAGILIYDVYLFLRKGKDMTD